MLVLVRSILVLSFVGPVRRSFLVCMYPTMYRFPVYRPGASLGVWALLLRLSSIDGGYNRLQPSAVCTDDSVEGEVKVRLARCAERVGLCTMSHSDTVS